MKPPTEPLERIGYADRVRLLLALETHPGFHFFVERHAQILAQDIDAAIFDTKTSDEDCRLLREVRKRMVDQYAPEKILQKLIVSTQGERDRAADAADRARKA
ncbi:MAG TPA: hypothetical protein VHF69_00875 [Candidatus Synoicihabitans sp.]|nr:hypothetical protein [Candidatus Synoicihabitans sp.]